VVAAAVELHSHDEVGETNRDVGDRLRIEREVALVSGPAFGEAGTEVEVGIVNPRVCV
jgi:hypothetical protein